MTFRFVWITIDLNSSRPRPNRRHFEDDIFKCIFLNENVWIPIKISLKFVPKGPINNIPALVQIMAWRRPGDKPLSGPVMTRLPTHICATRPQWVKSSCGISEHLFWSTHCFVDQNTCSDQRKGFRNHEWPKKLWNVYQRDQHCDTRWPSTRMLSWHISFYCPRLCRNSPHTGGCLAQRTNNAYTLRFLCW